MYIYKDPIIRIIKSRHVSIFLCRAYSGYGAPAFFLHSDIIMPYISKYGSEEQRQKYIAGMTSGKIVSSIAMTEPDAGRYIYILS